LPSGLPTLPLVTVCPSGPLLSPKPPLIFSSLTAELGEWDWKLIVIFQMLVPIIIIALIFFIPESPRWLVQKGRIDDARAALRKFRDTEDEIETEILEMREAMEYEAQQTKGTSIWRVYKQIWSDKSLRWRMFLAVSLPFPPSKCAKSSSCSVLHNAGQQLTGQGSLNSYSSVIYKKVFNSASTISLINALNATFGISESPCLLHFLDVGGTNPVGRLEESTPRQAPAPTFHRRILPSNADCLSPRTNADSLSPSFTVFTLNAAWLVERIGRKWLLAGGAAGQAICMLIVALVGMLTPGGDSKSEPVAISIVFLLFLFILFYKPTWGATVWIWTR
jgi:hypothetical protein